MYGGKKNSIFSQGTAIIKEYTLVDEPNLSARPKMEDSYIIADNILKDNDLSQFGVQDGHGGPDVAVFAAKTIPMLFPKMHKASPKDIKKVFEATVDKQEAQLRLTGAVDCGATCCLFVSRMEQGSKIYYLGNIGDTRAVLCQGGKGTQL